MDKMVQTHAGAPKAAAATAEPGDAAPARVGVVIPCKNEIATLAACLQSIRAQQPSVARIVVVDNGSTDGSLAIASELADVVVPVPEGRLGRLRNLGTQALADVDVVAFVDADIELSPGWIASALRELATADVVGNRSVAPAESGWISRRLAAIEVNTVHDGSNLWTQAMAVRRRTFDAVGGFDESLLTGEDTDLSTRIRSAGGQVRFVPDMVAVHHGYPSTLSGFLRRERWHTTSDPEWFGRMSRRSRALVIGAGVWVLVGGAAAGVAAARGKGAPLATWTAVSLGCVPALGLLGGRDPRHCAEDGVLLTVWALNRAARLGVQAARPRTPSDPRRRATARWRSR